MTVLAEARVLVIAASDSSGGAGLSRDLETLGALGVRGAMAVTAVTVQTDKAVEVVSFVEPTLIAKQMRAAFATHPIAATKIGVLGNASAVETVAEVMLDHAAPPAILDPVIMSSSGEVFLDDKAIAALRDRLMPLCELISPNRLELARLVGEANATSDQAAIDQAHALQRLGANAVLVKGGHAVGTKAVDILVDAKGEPTLIEAERLISRARGTGCMLSAAIAGYRAAGAKLETACRRAKVFVWSKLDAEAATAGG